MAGTNYLSQKVLAAVPYAKELRVTPTYSNQLLPEHYVVMALGNPKDMADAIISAHKPEMENKEKPQLEIQLKSLQEELDALNASRSSRAKPFLQYAVDKEKVSYKGRISSNLMEKIESNAELTSGDIDRFVNQVYHTLSEHTRATESTKRAIRDYIRNGEVNEEMLLWFGAYVDSIFEKFKQYTELNNRLQQISQTTDTSELEQTLTQTIKAIKSGKGYQEEIEFGSLRINLKQELQQLTGMESGKPFLRRINELAEGKNTTGLIVPFEYKAANGTNVPEELKPYYMPVDKFGQIITLFDTALTEMLISYANGNQGVAKISRELFSKNVTKISKGVFMWAIFPEGHQPTLTLYSDGRIHIPKEDENIRKIMELIRNGREEIPKAAAKHFGMPEEQIKFEELVSLQAQLMQLLPFQVYICADVASRISYNIDQAKTQRAQLTQKDRMLVAKYEINDKQLQMDFGVNCKKIGSITETTLDEAIKLFGEEFGFIQKVLSRKLEA